MNIKAILVDFRNSIIWPFILIFYTIMFIINGIAELIIRLKQKVMKQAETVQIKQCLTLIDVLSGDFDILMHFHDIRTNSIHGMMLSIDRTGIISDIAININTHFGILFMVSTPS